MPRAKKNEEPQEAEVVGQKEVNIHIHRSRGTGRIVVGLLLITFGGMLIADNLLNINLFQYFWPSVLIIIGLAMIIRSVDL